jgi:HAD superfamily hydrolase (TIGR01450 family)
MRLESLQQMELLQQFYRHQQQQDSTDPLLQQLPLLVTSVEEATRYRRQQQIQTVLLDCDGVVYRTTDVSPDAASCIRSLLVSPSSSSSPSTSSSDTAIPKLFFVTNNASTNRSDLRRKLQRLLFPESSTLSADAAPLLTDDMMIPTSYAAAQYLRQELLSSSSLSPTISCSNLNNDDNAMNQNDDTKLVVHVIGSSGLCDEVKQAGFHVTTVVEDDEEPTHSMTRDELAQYPFDTTYPQNTMAAMVIGLDTKFSYRKLCIANVLLQRHPQALCVATNMDTHDLVGIDGRHLPGNGSIVACVAYASQRHFVDVGKPSQHLSKIVMNQVNHQLCNHQDSDPNCPAITPSQCLMVGDRLDTDIAFARKSGMKSALVLTGVTTAQDVISIILRKQDQQQIHVNAIVKGNEDDDELILPDVIIPYLGLLAA